MKEEGEAGRIGDMGEDQCLSAAKRIITLRFPG